MESTYDFIIRRNKEMSQKDGIDLVHFFITTEYGTYSQNRYSIATEVFKALQNKGNLLNKIVIKKVKSDLVRNFKPTKSTVQTHEKKIEKLRKEFDNIIQFNTNAKVVC